MNYNQPVWKWVELFYFLDDILKYITIMNYNPLRPGMGGIILILEWHFEIHHNYDL